MKKRNLAFLGVATVAALSLAGCNNGKKSGTASGVSIKSNYTYTEAPADEVYDTDGGRVDVNVNYNGESGISRRGASIKNKVDGQTYIEGNLLPTWKAFAKKTRTTIVDASDYQGKETVAAPKIENKNFENQNKNEEGNYIDVLYQKTNQINTWGKDQKLVALDEHLDEMPNFKAYLEKNKGVREDITYSNGHIYFTPYFDGYNDVERCLIMDTSLVEKVLDATSFDNFDTTMNGGSNPAGNVVQKGNYTPFICADNNYPSAQTVKVSVNNEAKDMTIKQTGYNIIAKQNELLQAGCTGKQLAEQFHTYLMAAFGDNVGEGKIYTKLSQIFTAQQAAYNADELIALMRVVKANPGVISGDANNEIVILQPRGENDSRVHNILQFAQIWGVQGLVSEKDFLYFTNDGKMNDARSTTASYDAVKYLSALYDEGLILENFWYNEKKDGNKYLNLNFIKNKDDWGYALLEYDYVATQVVANDQYEGVGTLSSSRSGSAKNLEVKGIKPILAPLSYWGTGTVSVTQSLTDKTGKTLMRHYDENRSVKDTGFCVPANSENKAGAFRLIDYLWSKMGALIQDYGPEEYWNVPNLEKGDKLVDGLTFDSKKAYVATDYLAGELVPIISAAVKSMWNESNADYWGFMRTWIGSTHGVGHERSKSIQLQCCNYYGQLGLADLETAMANGVCDVSLNDKDGDGKLETVTWNTSVPVNNYNEPDTEESKPFASVTHFWNNKKLATKPTGWVYVVQAGFGKDLSDEPLGTDAANNNYKYSDVLNQIDVFNKTYLYKMAGSFVDGKFIPDYAKSTN